MVLLIFLPICRKSAHDASLIRTLVWVYFNDINTSVSQHLKIQEEFRKVWGKTENSSNYIRHKNTLDKMRATDNQNRFTNHATIEDKQYDRVSSSTNYNINLSTPPAKWLIEKTNTNSLCLSKNGHLSFKYTISYQGKKYMTHILKIKPR